MTEIVAYDGAAVESVSIPAMVNPLLNTLSPKYVVERALTGRKVFAACPRPEAVDGLPIRVYYPPVAGESMPQSVKVSLDEARRMAAVLVNAIIYVEQGGEVNYE